MHTRFVGFVSRKTSQFCHEQCLFKDLCAHLIECYRPGTTKKRKINNTGPSMVMLDILLIVIKYFIVVTNEIYMNSTRCKV